VARRTFLKYKTHDSIRSLQLPSLFRIICQVLAVTCP